MDAEPNCCKKKQEKQNAQHDINYGGLFDVFERIDLF